MTITIGEHELTLDELWAVASGSCTLALGRTALKRIEKSHAYLQSKLKETHTAYYGINTGFGSFCTTKISAENLRLLQTNLIKSHAAGSGPLVPNPIVRLMLALKIQNLSLGYSGVGPKLVQALAELYNHDILPLIPTQGSLGASGDLAPLAHMSLALLGLGKVCYQNQVIRAADALKKAGLKPIVLGPKEGLALINGTQFSTAYAAHLCVSARALIRVANTTLALSLEAFDADAAAFDPVIHRVRAHSGQVKTAQYVCDILKGSPRFVAAKPYIQDPYSFRCAPQVHGASEDALDYVCGVVETEINSVSDNPLLFEGPDKIISGGNFHAQPIALALDFLAMALSELASISERRTFKLLSGERGLQPNLATKPGLESGLMIAQYTAASIVSQNKQLCTPASVDSIVSSAGQEDHVSMAANAATKCFQVLENVYTVIAIEFLTAFQAFSSRKLRSSPIMEDILDRYREEIAFFETDVILSTEIEKTRAFLRQSAHQFG